MSMSKGEADAQLAAIDDVVGRVKQSRIYRVAGEIAMMWGGMQFLQYAYFDFAPAAYARGWLLVDALGVALTLFLLRRAGASRATGWARALAAFALFYGFGFVWSGALGHFDGREQSVFWHTLFLFGYCLAGLWFGVGFLAIGISLSALILAVYLFAGPTFWLLIALVSGFGYILCGYWMWRA
jgi:hypothetical protein